MKEVVGHKKDLGEIAEIKLAAAGKPTDDDRGEVEDESGVKGRESRGETFSKESKGRNGTQTRPGDVCCTNVPSPREGSRVFFESTKQGTTGRSRQHQH